jgi:hypothetical protein
MSSESAFEYDEDIEAADETFEAADEADEAADEADEAADEADEAADEADEAADEADEAADEADEAADEADESLYEADEADEAADEAMSLSAQLRVNQAKARRAAFARKIAARQRIEAQKASATRRDVNERIQQIRKARAGVARIRPVGRLQGAGVVTAVLPNGRKTRMRIIPTVAPVAEVNSLRAILNSNEKRQAAATAANARAIAALGAAQVAALKKLTAQQINSDRELGKRIVEGHSSLDKRITKELNNRKTDVERNQKRALRMLKRQRTRSLWNSILLASSAPLFAAYGDRNNPLSRNNLILTGSLLGFLGGDEVIDWATRRTRMRKFGGTVANIWSYLAPVANGALAYWLLDDKIHDRFKAGVDTVAKKDGTILVPLTIPKGSQADFLKLVTAEISPPVVATLVDAKGEVSAKVVNKGTATAPDFKVQIQVNGIENDDVKVAWMVELLPATSRLSEK